MRDYADTTIGSNAITTQQRWSQSRQCISQRQPMLGALLEPLQVVTVSEAGAPLASTNGRHVWVNPWADAQLAPERRAELLAHLAVHCALLHPWARLPKDARRWHLSCDHEVNALLLWLGWLHEEAVLFVGGIGYTLERIYVWLANHPQLHQETSLDPCPGISSHPDIAAPTTRGRIYWQAHVRSLVQTYRHGPWLPEIVAEAFLSRCEAPETRVALW